MGREKGRGFDRAGYRIAEFKLRLRELDINYLLVHVGLLKALVRLRYMRTGCVHPVWRVIVKGKTG
jgi:hypothetical protein